MAATLLIFLGSFTPGETAGRLDGKWLSVENKTGSFIITRWTFNSDTGELATKIRTTASLIDFFVVEVNATYRATPGELMVKYDKGEPRVYMCDEMKEAIDLPESEVAEFIADISDIMRQQMSGTPVWRIKTLTDSLLVVEGNDLSMTFKKEDN